MELFTAAEDLKSFNVFQIINEAVRIPARSSPLKFGLITLTLILPLSLIQLLFDLSFSHFLNIFDDCLSGRSSPSLIRTYSLLEIFYLLSLFLFSLLSTSAVVFTVASLYASKPVSFIPTLFAIPRIFKQMAITFFYALLLMILSYLALCPPILVLVWLNVNEALMWIFIIILAIPYVYPQFYVTALWHLVSVISVLEPNVCGLAAMKNSKQLLQGKTQIALPLANFYLAATWGVEKVFQLAMQSHIHFMVKLLLGLLCLFMLLAINLTGLLAQTVFFLACKSHQNQVVDKKVLYDHLGGYDLRKSVALNPSTGSVEMQSLVSDHDRASYQPVALNAITDTVGDLQNVENGEPLV
ncbi:hypothetical protein MKW94_012643 [Papaver nudicaule]|uniref:Transmembrane protein n=1 Tax=Papaver nudicaule TaxID=74823 RepID=A0AA42B537_PAPNU|nr:hypothetical protein [Papaver nudicaule]